MKRTLARGERQNGLVNSTTLSHNFFSGKQIAAFAWSQGSNTTGIYGRLKIVIPRITAIATNAKKKKKMNLAIDAAPEAISVKPKTAAIIAITKKMAAHFSIVVVFSFVWMFSFVISKAFILFHIANDMTVEIKL